MVKKDDGMIEAIGSDAFAANFRGTISDHNLEDHFSTAAGKSLRPLHTYLLTYLLTHSLLAWLTD